MYINFYIQNSSGDASCKLLHCVLKENTLRQWWEWHEDNPCSYPTSLCCQYPKSISTNCRVTNSPQFSQGFSDFSTESPARNPVIQANRKKLVTRTACPISWDLAGHPHVTAHRCLILRRTQTKLFLTSCKTALLLVFPISVNSTTIYPEDHTRHLVFFFFFNFLFSLIPYLTLLVNSFSEEHKFQIPSKFLFKLPLDLCIGIKAANWIPYLILVHLVFSTLNSEQLFSKSLMSSFHFFDKNFSQFPSFANRSKSTLFNI